MKEVKKGVKINEVGLLIGLLVGLLISGQISERTCRSDQMVEVLSGGPKACRLMINKLLVVRKLIG